MSKDQQKPAKQTPKLGTGQAGTPLQKVSQTLEQTWKQAQPVLSVLSIKALRGTIHLLKGVVKKLEAEPIEQLGSAVATPSQQIPGSIPVAAAETESAPVVMTEELPASTPVDVSTVTTQIESVPENSNEELLISTPVDFSTGVPKTVTPVVTPVAKEPAMPTFVDSVLPSFERVQSWRNTVLKTIRALLPESLNQKLSDWVLTGAIASIIVILLWTTVALLPSKQVEVANIPPAKIEAPSELKAPKSPSPVKIAPSPETILTPEQTLIASIQNKVAEITNQYADGLIQSLEVNFQGSILIVKVSDGWYDLNPSKQDKLADEMLRRSQELDFNKLEITDPEGTLLARTPVVGSHMVILQRRVLAAKL